ncbi:MAG: dihydropteroate synthase [Halieaceae bacterium]
MISRLQCGQRSLNLASPVVMGILNVTPDSFSDGGQLYHDRRIDLDALLNRAQAMVDAGAQMLDIGGESTRPGADEVSEGEELDRVLPAIEALAARFDVVISVDTSSPDVMTEGARLGAGFLNDVRGFRRPGALEAAAATHLPICIMHMQGEPRTMQAAPAYLDIITEVRQFLEQRIAACTLAGIAAQQIVVDPGFGFGKTADQNFEMLARLGELNFDQQPLLVGLSRKSMIASVVDRGPHERLHASLGLAMIAVERGARIVRVHDVAETVDALAMWRALPRSFDQ